MNIILERRLERNQRQKAYVNFTLKAIKIIGQTKIFY